MEIRELPLPDELLPCPMTCEAGTAVSKPRLVVKKLDTPPGDDTLAFRGQVVLPHPFAPALDPVAVGAGVVIEDTAGVRVLDVTVPGGAYDPASDVGWTAARSGTSWRYLDRSAAPPAGVTKVSIKDMSRKQPGLVRVKVTGKRGDYPVDGASLPLTGLLVLDPPTAATGQCGVATFVGPKQSCSADGKSVRCR